MAGQTGGRERENQVRGQEEQRERERIRCGDRRQRQIIRCGDRSKRESAAETGSRERENQVRGQEAERESIKYGALWNEPLYKKGSSHRTENRSAYIGRISLKNSSFKSLCSCRSL
jgi:hypothetical protein